MTPTTLPALRAALRRVLVARGEAPDALVCDGYMGVAWYALELRAADGRFGHPLATDVTGDDEGAACESAWGLVIDRLEAEVRREKSTSDDLRVRALAATRRLAVARLVLDRARSAAEAAGCGDG